MGTRLAAVEHDLDLQRFEPLTALEVYLLVQYRRRSARSAVHHRAGLREGRPPEDAEDWGNLHHYLRRTCPDLPVRRRTDYARAFREMPDLRQPKNKYSLWAQALPGEWFTFMNYGYSADSHLSGSGLTKTERCWHMAVNLYRHVVAGVPLRACRVLDVGCGRGGGAAFLARHCAPRFLTGIDLSRSNVRFCRSVHRLPNLGFLHGDAERLPVKSAGVDVVVNVESCTYYPAVRQFLREARRVLVANGYLCQAVCASPDWMDSYRGMCESEGLKLSCEDDILPRVQASLRRMDEELPRLVAKCESPARRAAYLEALGEIYRARKIRRGEVEYRSFVFRT